jgi:hypothetical protein
LFACINFSLSLAYGKETDPFPAIEIPVFHSGYDIKKEVDRSSANVTVDARKFMAAAMNWLSNVNLFTSWEQPRPVSNCSQPPQKPELNRKRHL